MLFGVAMLIHKIKNHFVSLFFIPVTLNKWFISSYFNEQRDDYNCYSYE